MPRLRAPANAVGGPHTSGHVAKALGALTCAAHARPPGGPRARPLAQQTDTPTPRQARPEKAGEEAQRTRE
eukprot:10453122-Alexandrium_andersonii.AAC.1